MLELDMANPKELREAADAIRDVRRLPAVQRHKELEDLLKRAEEWARREHRKVCEETGNPNLGLRTSTHDNAG